MHIKLNALQSEKPRFHFAVPCCMAPSRLNLSFSSSTLSFLPFLNVCYSWFFSQPAFIPVKHALCSLVAFATLLQVKQHISAVVGGGHREGASRTRSVEGPSPSPLSLEGVFLLPFWKLFKDAAVREQCVVQTIWTVYLTECKDSIQTFKTLAGQYIHWSCGHLRQASYVSKFLAY